jgi:hypothetical protein
MARWMRAVGIRPGATRSAPATRASVCSPSLAARAGPWRAAERATCSACCSCPSAGAPTCSASAAGMAAPACCRVCAASCSSSSRPAALCGLYSPRPKKMRLPTVKARAPTAAAAACAWPSSKICAPTASWPVTLRSRPRSGAGRGAPVCAEPSAVRTAAGRAGWARGAPPPSKVRMPGSPATICKTNWLPRVTCSPRSVCSTPLSPWRRSISWTCLAARSGPPGLTSSSVMPP